MALTNAPKAKYFNLSSPAEHVIHVEINRPEKMNAFCEQMWNELRSIFDHLSVQPDVRCVMISGAGDRAFTTGLDVVSASSSDGGIASTSRSDPSRRATSLRRLILDFQSAINAVARCEKPVIALMHGYAFGLAIDLSSACDIRICTADTRFSVKEVDIGLAADVGTLSRIGKVVGGITGWVKEICFTARPFSADEAYRNRFVNEVVTPTTGGKKELVEAGLTMAKLIASKSPVAVQGTKNILDASWGRTIEDNLNYTAVWNSAMLQSSDVERAMSSGSKKRTPTFEKL